MDQRLGCGSLYPRLVAYSRNANSKITVGDKFSWATRPLSHSSYFAPPLREIKERFGSAALGRPPVDFFFGAAIANIAPLPSEKGDRPEYIDILRNPPKASLQTSSLDYTENLERNPLDVFGSCRYPETRLIEFVITGTES